LEVFPLEDFQKVMDINFWGVIYGVHSFLPRMIRQKSGHIVNTASGAGLNAVIPLGAYSASKFAIVGYTEVLRAELRRHNIGVTAICPGIINTNIVKDGKATLIEGSRADQEKMAAFYQRFGWPPERVARGVLKGIRKNRGIVPVGPEVWIGWYIKRFSITVSDMINSMVAKFMLR
jgi:NAD(P)-dependent dehydrogenase (short-subunit alcohol dehydrogenase family)